MSFSESLQNLKQHGLFRELKPIQSRHHARTIINGQSYLDLASNDYLGLSRHPELMEGVKQALDDWGFGATGSRLLGGDYDVTHQLQQKMAAFVGTSHCLVFNSGYQANVGLITSIAGPGDIIFADKYVHASLLDGIRLSGASWKRFRHHDMDHLRQLLTRYRSGKKKAYILTESLFSMHADTPPLDQLVDIKRSFDAELIVDEAHAMGVLGPDGRGLSVGHDVDWVVGTFGKAWGSSGAFVACSEAGYHWLINSARSFIYSTALPPMIMAWNEAVLDRMSDWAALRSQLAENVRQVRDQFSAAGLDVWGDHHIGFLPCESVDHCCAVADQMQAKGYWMVPIRQPTVPAGQEGLRWSIHAHHRADELEEWIDDLRTVYQSTSR